MNKAQTLNAFWNGFTWKAYDENSVPDKTQTPYLTYEASFDSFGNQVPMTVNLWDRSASWTDIAAKEQQISDFITRGGRMVAYDGGAMWIQKGTPWAQRLGDESDEMMRRIVLNVVVEFLD